MKKKRSVIEIISTVRFLHILLAIILGFAVGALFLTVMGISVGDAYGKLLDSVTTVKGISYVIVYATPLPSSVLLTSTFSNVTVPALSASAT